MALSDAETTRSRTGIQARNPTGGPEQKSVTAIRTSAAIRVKIMRGGMYAPLTRNAWIFPARSAALVEPSRGSHQAISEGPVQSSGPQTEMGTGNLAVRVAPGQQTEDGAGTRRQY